MHRFPRSKFVAASAGASGLVHLAPAPARAAQFQYKLGHPNPVSISQHVRLTEMAAAVERETAGRLEITIFPNGMLGSSSAMLSQLRLGALQLLDMTHSLYAAVAPAAQIDSVGFSLSSSQQAWRALDGQLGAYIRREFAAKGIYVFEKTLESGFRQMSTWPKPIKNMDDFAGLKIRTISAPIFVDLFKALGAAPVPLDPSELYVAMQTHIADGQDSPLQAVETYRLYEVQRYISITNHVWSGDWLAMNADAWKALPSDIQTIVERNVRKYTLLQRTDSQVFTKSLADKLKRQGLAFNVADTSGVRSRLSSYYATWKNEFGSTAWSLLEAEVGKMG